MRDLLRDSCGGVATVRKPRVVLAGDVAGGAGGRLAELFRKRDWDVYAVPASEDLACALLARRPSAVILPATTEWESGYLLAAKIRRARPKVKVVLVAALRTAEGERFADFVGATLVAESDGLARIIHVAID